MNLQKLVELQQQLPPLKCGKCRACCVKDTVLLDPGSDDLSYFKWRLESGRPVLDRKANDECIYLTENGCSTHDRLPRLCRLFDCRAVVMLSTKKERKDQVRRVPEMRLVYEAGQSRIERLNT